MFSQLNTKTKTLEQLYTDFNKIGGLIIDNFAIDVLKNNNVYKIILTDKDNAHTSLFVWREED